MQPQPKDLFGQVQVTKSDIYAWLLAVPQMDPSSPRAATYVRDYGVVQKITGAKLNGSFDATTEDAQNSSRYWALVELDLLSCSTNIFGVGEWPKIQRRDSPMSRSLRAPNRPKEVIRKEKARLAREKALRRVKDSSLLNRLPKWTQPLSYMLTDIGNPSAAHLAKTMKVSENTARKWIAKDEAPMAVMLAIFCLTKEGMTTLETNAHNTAALYYRLAEAQKDQLTALKGQMARVERLADFGAANDPSPNIKTSQRMSRLVIPRPPEKSAATPKFSRLAR